MTDTKECGYTFEISGVKFRCDLDASHFPATRHNGPMVKPEPDWRQTIRALTVLLRAKCSDAEWEVMGKKYDELVTQQSLPDSPTPDDKVRDLINAAKVLLAWVPICSEGSSGHSYQVALQKAIADIESPAVPCEHRTRGCNAKGEWCNKCGFVIRGEGPSNLGAPDAEEWKRKALALVVLLKAVCSDAQWAEMAKNFDVELGAPGAGQAGSATKCKYGDPTCPCPDGDMCHYVGADGWLLPCPFCGGMAKMEENVEDFANFIECKSCGASTNLQYSLKDDGRPHLVERWNNRVTNAILSASPSEPKAGNEESS